MSCRSLGIPSRSTSLNAAPLKMQLGARAEYQTAKVEVTDNHPAPVFQAHWRNTSDGSSPSRSGARNSCNGT